MSFAKILGVLVVLLFGTIGLMAVFKSSGEEQKVAQVTLPFTEKKSAPLEFELDRQVQTAQKQGRESAPALNEKVASRPVAANPEPPEADRIQELFNTGMPKLPIVETIVYSSRVSWSPGKDAWVGDYATHYQTSRHFIARSLNGKRDYFDQNVANGDRFNVFRKEIKLHFHLLVDATRCKMWMYYVNEDANERVLVKTYRVGLGRPDPQRASGMLTPLGKYSLGSKIAVYKPGANGIYNGQKTEMIRVFGTRWIPFDKEISECTAPAKGLGIHACPWEENAQGALSENLGGIGGNASDGCIRLATEDMEELFAVIITKPTVIEIVKDFYDAELPGVEVE